MSPGSRGAGLAPLDTSEETIANATKSATSVSYVYPVRSLLSGIQPAENSEQVRTSSNDNSRIATAARTVSSEATASERAVGEYDTRHPAPITSAAADGLAANNSTTSFVSLAHGGYVHIGPISDSAPSSNYESDKVSTASFTGSILVSKARDKLNHIKSDDSPPEQPVDEESRSKASSLILRSKDGSIVSSSGEPLVSFRFEHVHTEDGHHVVTGRRPGELTRCEDEPIRVPGAIQGFGVLIAVEENEETGNLLVRQVSENSGELLGLSPRYLFSLDCFTTTLPSSQADILWDSIQYLSDPDLDAESGDDGSPQVFLLSGWGEPGSVLFDESDDARSQMGRELERRRWTCWCAIHRPPGNGNGKTKNSSLSTESSPPNPGPALIILEFELEHDIFNPLYPPLPSHITHFSGATSPGTYSTSDSSDTKIKDGSASTIGNTPGLASESSTSTLTSSGNGEQPVTQGHALRESISRMSSQFTNASSDIEAVQGLVGTDGWLPSSEDVLESTTNRAKPLRALERMRRMTRPSKPRSSARGGAQGTRARRGGVGTMDIFAVLAQVNEQLGAAQDLDSFLKIVVGIIKDLTQFHRVLIYQFDEQWNGQVVAELVDWSQTHDLYNALHFPASDIPAQARDLYVTNKVRLLYDRDQTTARMVVRSKVDLERPLDMTHAFLRAMSPIHIKYLGNMGVRASMSISIVTFGALWGLIACHSYGRAGMRVSFPVRQMLRLLSDSVSRNIERLSYAQRLHTRKLISTMPTDSHPTGYIITNAEDLLGLFDADYGVLVVGEGAKILGPNQRSQDVLMVSEYLRLKQFKLMQVSQSVTKDFPDLQLSGDLDVIAGLLYVPLSSGGKDFITFLRKGQPRSVHWAGKPLKEGTEASAMLEPRKSFKMWSETVAGRCRAWTDEQLETAGVLALVYGKFIEVWRQKESAVQTTQLTNLLLSNASHEVRTPLNHIINYLELALNGPLDSETRENLTRSHTASKGLLFTINDLLDLTRLESGNETSFNEPFNLPEAMKEAVHLYSLEATRKKLDFHLDLSKSPETVIGDARKIRTVVANLTANALKFTSHGSITVECSVFSEPPGLRKKEIAVEIIVADTGCGIIESKLESIFQEFEQVESSSFSKQGSSNPGIGLGLAVVARIIGQLRGQLRVDSKPNEGSRFSLLVPFATTVEGRTLTPELSTSSLPFETKSRTNSEGSSASEIDSLVEALGQSHMVGEGFSGLVGTKPSHKKHAVPQDGKFNIEGSRFPVRSIKMDGFDIDKPSMPTTNPISFTARSYGASPAPVATCPPERGIAFEVLQPPEGLSIKLKVLVVEDENINRNILCKRLKMDGHEVLSATNGQEGAVRIEEDREFDIILMDIQMPILNGFQATKRIRVFEAENPITTTQRLSIRLNGRIPIFAVSASLSESQRDEMLALGMDGWILKPIDFKRLKILLSGIQLPSRREQDVYHTGCSWEAGGWLLPAHLYSASSPPLLLERD